MTGSGSTAATSPAVGPRDPTRKFVVRPVLVPVGIAFLLAMVPTFVAIDLWLGFYVPDVGYTDPSAVGVALVAILVFLVAGAICLFYARMPIRYPAPPFAAINPPSAFAADPFGTSKATEGSPLLYTDTLTAEVSFESRNSPVFSTLGYSVTPKRCPRCGWTGTVSLLNCPRCGLKL